MEEPEPPRRIRLPVTAVLVALLPLAYFVGAATTRSPESAGLSSGSAVSSHGDAAPAPPVGDAPRAATTTTTTAPTLPKIHPAPAVKPPAVNVTAATMSPPGSTATSGPRPPEEPISAITVAPVTTTATIAPITTVSTVPGRWNTRCRMNEPAEVDFAQWEVNGDRAVLSADRFALGSEFYLLVDWQQTQERANGGRIEDRGPEPTTEVLTGSSWLWLETPRGEVCPGERIEVEFVKHFGPGTEILRVADTDGPFDNVRLNQREHHLP